MKTKHFARAAIQIFFRYANKHFVSLTFSYLLVHMKCAYVIRWRCRCDVV